MKIWRKWAGKPIICHQLILTKFSVLPNEIILCAFCPLCFIHLSNNKHCIRKKLLTNHSRFGEGWLKSCRCGFLPHEFLTAKSIVMFNIHIFCTTKKVVTQKQLFWKIKWNTPSYKRIYLMYIAKTMRRSINHDTSINFIFTMLIFSINLSFDLSSLKAWQKFSLKFLFKIQFMEHKFYL